MLDIFFLNEEKIIFKMAAYRFVILVSTIGFSGTPDIVVWLESTLGHCIVGKVQLRKHIRYSIVHKIKDGRHYINVQQ